MRKKIVLLFVLTILSVSILFAGTTGKLAGRVKDADGNPIPYANIVLDGTTIGTQTKENGQYIIINIDPGTYDVVCSQVGYGTKKVTGVRINVDETTIQNFTLVTAALQVEGISVSEAREELVSKSRTSSGQSVTAESIEDVAVGDIEGIVAIQAGASETNGELHIRGGRANEVVYSVDGMSVSDPVDGGAALTVDKDAVQDMSVMTGGFTAEYGNAQSGIVNIVTKSGSEKYSGKVEFSSDHIIEDIDNSNSDVTKFALGGPVLGPIAPSMRDKFTFFFNGAANWHDSRYKDYYVTNPNEDLKYLYSSGYSEYDPYEDRDDFIGFDLGDRNYNQYNANLKMKYVFNPRQNLTVAIRGDRNVSNPYSHYWRFALDHYAKVETEQRQYAFTYDHSFSSQTNLKVKASIYSKTIEEGPDGIPRDSYFSYNGANVDPTFSYYLPTETTNTSNQPFIEILTDDGIIGEGEELDWEYLTETGRQYDVTPYFAAPGTIYPNNIDDETQTFSFRSDFEYQYNQIHGFKTGIEIIKHDIRKNRQYNPWDIDAFRYDEYLKAVGPDTTLVAGDYIINGEEITLEEDTDFYTPEKLYNATMAAAGYTDGYEADPWQAAYYLQDKMEWEGMIVNAGLRFDFWYLGEKYKIFKDTGDVYKHFDNDDRMQLMVSPRLGISHPISENSVVHFAYNYQNQLPEMQYVFTSTEAEDAITNQNQNIIIGNPTLEPQITATYEVGWQHQFGEDYVMDITAYYKNIYNYVSTEKVYLQDDGSLIPYSEVQASDNPDQYDTTTELYKYITQDYGSARGIDFNLSKMLSNFISGSMAYSLSWAEGNNSDTVVQDEATNLREFPLDWDTRHNFNFNFNFNIGRGEEFFIPFTDVILPLDNFKINFLYNISSGKPYTPQDQEGNPLEVNSERYPHTEKADLKIVKTFNLNDNTYFKVYADIQNLFNRRNIYYVYPRTGNAYDDGVDLTETNTNYIPEARQYIHDLSTDNPSNYSSGRTLTFGMSFHW
ncbi:MAG: hypothetical protein PWQ09_1278 [Candidatus Cloacimonadota bacterium]|jgi:outer membrane receptor protein involved in Fe transport|nr:hypothetical protein [Candidatus Cloacimonadota bacterium]